MANLLEQFNPAFAIAAASLKNQTICQTAIYGSGEIVVAKAA